MLYTDCVRQCSGPMYVVSDGRGRDVAARELAGHRPGAVLRPGTPQTPPSLAGCPPGPLLTPSPLPWQDRMVLLVMGNIINWSL